MKSAVDALDSDSAHTPSDDDKKIGVVGQLENIGGRELPPDPDAGLSEEERARIVCLANRMTTQLHSGSTATRARADQTCQPTGQGTPVET